MRRLVRLGATALVVGILAPPISGHAQEPAAPEDASRYQSIVQDALTELERGHYAESRALFLEAHRLAPSARTLRGIGRTSFELRDYARAYRVLGEALTSTERPLGDRLRGEVTALRERARAFVALVTVRLSPADAELRVDGAPIEEAPLVLGLGDHELVASRGAREVRRTLTVTGGESETIALRVPAPEVVATTESPISTPVPRDPTVSVALSIAAGVLLAAGIVGAIYWADREAELARCGVGLCLGREPATLERDAGIGWTWGASGLGVVLAVVGLAVFPW
ncbi:MAG: hypothetical protein KC619_14740 [Myxococcales bacterium]|nr:hypothetical protein [Myxococcales bacterium]